MLSHYWGGVLEVGGHQEKMMELQRKASSAEFCWLERESQRKESKYHVFYESEGGQTKI